MRCLLAASLLVACGGDGVQSDAGPGDGTIDAAPGTYQAWAIISALNRVRIANLTTDVCFEVQLYNPVTNTSAITLPPEWALDHARAVQPMIACNPAYLGPIQNTFDATDAAGAIEWTAPSNMTPTKFDSVQVTLTFANPPSWCPPSTTLSVSNLVVQ